MNDMKRTIIYILAVIFMPLVARSQEYITLERAREMTLEKNEDIKIADTYRKKAEADKKTARTQYLPALSVEASGLYMNDNISTEQYLPTFNTDVATGQLTPNVAINPNTGEVITGADGVPVFNQYAYLPLEVSMQGAYMAGIKVEQPLYTGGKINAGNKMAAIGVQMAEENMQVNKMNAIREVDNAYWLYVSVQVKVKLAQSSVEMYEKLLDRVQNSKEAGLATRNDVLKVQVEYDKACLNLQKAKSGQDLTRMSLCRITGLDFNTPIVTDTTITISSDFLAQLGSENVAERPEYKLLEKSIDIEEQRIKAVRADYLPMVGVSAGYNYIGGIEINSTELNQNNMNVMASVKIPVFNWFEGKHKATSAKAQKSIKELELQKNAGLLQLEIENAKINLQDALLRIITSESAVEQAKENLRVSNDTYAAGKELLTDRLIAQTQWEKANSELIEAKTAYKLQETEYLRVTAKLLVEE